MNFLLMGQRGGKSFARNFGVDSGSLQEGDGAVIDLANLSPVGTPEKMDGAAFRADINAEKASGCWTEKVQDLGAKWIPVGGVFSQNSGGTIDYQYSTGQSSKLGSSLSTKSATSGFSASGSSSVSSTATVDFPVQKGVKSRLAKTKFEYAKFRTTCYAPFISRTSWTIRATSWSGGTSFANVPAPNAKYCVPYLKGSKFTKSKDKQVTWTGAVSFYGVGLSAQTGWSTKGKLAFNFASKSGKLCGVGGQATSKDSYQIVMK